MYFLSNKDQHMDRIYQENGLAVSEESNYHLDCYDVLVLLKKYHRFSLQITPLGPRGGSYVW
jgi:hypothetical protein